MVKLLPLYIILLLISILIVWGISHVITSSLSVVSEQLKQHQQGADAKHIEYVFSDEVGEIITQYNLMVDALEESSERLARTEREMAWRTMARQVAHEINNPLTPMKLTLQQLQRTQGTERFNDYFQRSTQLLIDQIDNLSHIAKSFSSFAKMPEVNPTEVDVANKLFKVITLMRNNTDQVPIRYVGPENGIMAMADADQITQVFNNILRNALQAMEGRPNSDIIVILKPANQQTVEDEQLNPNRDWIKISISDNGPGIPEEMQEKVFVPNFTTKNTGAGLGMPISKNIVEGSGGKICFQTSEKGTTFFVYLRKK
jgi:nitrogen fixation/metabolism regulation signal transduction histidine kinase